MTELTVRKIGNSLGFILPKEATAALKVAEGDKLYLTSAADGMRITAYDPGFEEKMQIVGKYSRKYRNALRELAK